MVISSVWFKWSNPCDRIRAWRAVGITASGLRPDIVDRSTFCLHEQPQICTDEPQTPRPQHQYSTRAKVAKKYVDSEEKERRHATPSPMDRTSRSLRYYREKAEAWERAYKTRPRIQLEEMGACTVPS
eukprot:scaffold7919_cov2057-Prasinococcus_capsulatus_cf.AAC.1